MTYFYLTLFVCPDCREDLNLKENKENKYFICKNNHKFPIKKDIPRFVPQTNYADSFGFEWQTFSKTQVDVNNEVKQSEWRIRRELGWTPEKVRGKLILDAGCGSGRFSEVLSSWGANVVALDYSYAVDSAKETLKDRKNIYFVQGNLLNLPFKNNVFDGVFCIGVIQHTPRPLETIDEMCRVLKVGGFIGLSGVYVRDLKHLLHPKYLFRPITKKIPHKILYKLIKNWVSFSLPISRFLRKKLHIKAGIVERLLCVANYEGLVDGINDSNVFEWALLDTFDWFSPEYDNPVTHYEVQNSLKHNSMLNIVNTNSAGIAYEATKK